MSILPLKLRLLHFPAVWGARNFLEGWLDSARKDLVWLFFMFSFLILLEAAGCCKGLSCKNPELKKYLRNLHVSERDSS